MEVDVPWGRNFAKNPDFCVTKKMSLEARNETPDSPRPNLLYLRTLHFDERLQSSVKDKRHTTFLSLRLRPGARELIRRELSFVTALEATSPPQFGIHPPAKLPKHVGSILAQDT